MNAFTLKITVILCLLGLFHIIDVVDDQLIVFLGLPGDGLVELLFDSGSAVLELALVIWALLLTKNIFNQLSNQEKQYRHLIELSPEAIIIHDRGDILYLNKAAELLIGVSQEEASDFNLIEFVHSESLNNVRALESKPKYNQHPILKSHIKAVRQDGNEFDAEVSSRVIEYDGRPAREVIARDVSDHKKETEAVRQLAYQDALTNLPNRRAFSIELDKAIIAAKKNNTMSAVIFIDLDGFKQINDSYGHEAGDNLLTQVSSRFKKCVSEKDMVARFAGDEFVILLPDGDYNNAVNTAERIIECLNFPIRISDTAIRVTPSIGIAVYPQDGNDTATLINHADIAMYQAKKQGKNNYRLYQAGSQ